MTKDSKMIEPHPKLIWPYLVWTFAITWSAWGLQAFMLASKALKAGDLTWQLLYIVGGWGPVIATLIVVQGSFKDKFRMLFSLGKKGGWLYLLIMMGLLMLVGALATSGRVNEGVTPLALLTNFLIITFLTTGIGEEAGWRGILQPALEARFTFPVATILTGLIWACWHLPLMLTNLAGFPIFVLYTVLYSFWFAGLYKKTKSVLYCMLLHGFLNGGVGVIFNFERENITMRLLGMVIMAAYSIYLWYQTDCKERSYDETK